MTYPCANPVRPRRPGQAAARFATLLPLALGVALNWAAPSAALAQGGEPTLALETQAPGRPLTRDSAYPRITLDVNMNLLAIGTPTASPGTRRGFNTFLFGEVAPGFHLSDKVSVQAILHPDPAGAWEPQGAATFLYRQNIILEQLFAEWRPVAGLQVFAGKVNAPFGYGFDYFPGVVSFFRSHDVYLIREQLGAGANWTLPLPPSLGEHTLSAAIFTLDTSVLSNSLIVRQTCCAPGFDRYVRNTLSQGGSGNNGNLSNASLALEGTAIPALPGLTYNLGLVTRAPGKDATAREWGWEVGLRYEQPWSDAIRTRAYTEYVEFRNAEGNPWEPAVDGTEVVVDGRGRFLTLGTSTDVGPWRGTLNWQRFEQKRSANPIPTQNWIEASGGRELGAGFRLDVGYEYARFATDDGTLGTAHSVIGRLNYVFSR